MRKEWNLCCVKGMVREPRVTWADKHQPSGMLHERSTAQAQSRKIAHCTLAGHFRLARSCHSAPLATCPVRFLHLCQCDMKCGSTWLSDSYARGKHQCKIQHDLKKQVDGRHFPCRTRVLSPHIAAHPDPTRPATLSTTYQGPSYATSNAAARSPTYQGVSVVPPSARLLPPLLRSLLLPTPSRLVPALVRRRSRPLPCRRWLLRRPCSRLPGCPHRRLRHPHLPGQLLRLPWPQGQVVGYDGVGGGS